MYISYLLGLKLKEENEMMKVVANFGILTNRRLIDIINSLELAFDKLKRKHSI